MSGGMSVKTAFISCWEKDNKGQEKINKIINKKLRIMISN
jgi:hypothetical protein